MKPTLSVTRSHRNTDLNCDQNSTIARQADALKRLHKQRGFSLVEMMMVVLILSITAAVVILNFSSTDPTKLDAAAQEFADAIRFARNEAKRNGLPMGFRFTTNDKRIQVFSVDTSSSPWIAVYDIYHPVSKKLYDIDLDTHPFARADNLNRVGTFSDTCNQTNDIYFNEFGVARCIDPETVRLLQFEITFNLGAHSRKVSLNSITGRVTVQ